MHAAVVLALALLPAADEVPVRQVRFEERGRFLTMSVGLPELADDALKKRIRSGFASTIVLRVYLYREGLREPLGLTVRTYRVSYDLWEERYLVQIQDPSGYLNLPPFKTEAEALARITQLDGFPLAPLEKVPVGVRHFVAVLIEINPISPAHLAEMRRWLARPGGSERVSGGDTFFGSFISVFVNNKVSEAERELKFRSQPFFRPEPGPRK